MFIAVNKPVGISSFAVVARVRRLSGIRKVGHAGTLDPLASGVLVIAVGKAATTQIDTVVQKEKEYETTIFLGAYSTTDDAEGEKEIIAVKEPPSLQKVEAVLEQFVGTIQQKPPAFSAVHVGGKRAYALARAGKIVEMGYRTVQVKSIDLVEYAYPLLRLRVVTGPGTYIRSLARDIGKELGCGGYVESLARTRVGEFGLEKSVAFDDLAKYLEGHNADVNTKAH